MTSPDLPPLPQPDATDGYSAYHSTELLRAGQLAAYRAGMEAAAQMCEAQEGDAVTRAVAKGCAAAIRRAAEEAGKHADQA